MCDPESREKEKETYTAGAFGEASALVIGAAFRILFARVEGTSRGLNYVSLENQMEALLANISIPECHHVLGWNCSLCEGDICTR